MYMILSTKPNNSKKRKHIFERSDKCEGSTAWQQMNSKESGHLIVSLIIEAKILSFGTKMIHGHNCFIILTVKE